MLASASNFARLYELAPLHLHKLAGADDLYAVALQGRWRIVLRKVSETEIIVQEVSNHYGD